MAENPDHVDSPLKDATATVPGADATATVPGADATATVPGADATATVPGAVATATVPGADKDPGRASSTSAFTALFWSVVAFFRPAYEHFKSTHDSTKRMCEYLESVWTDWEEFHNQFTSTWDIPWGRFIEKGRVSRQNVLDYMRSGKDALELLFEIWYTSHTKLREHLADIQDLHDYIIPKPFGMVPFFPLPEENTVSIREYCFWMNMNLVQRMFHSGSKFLGHIRKFFSSTVIVIEFPSSNMVAHPEALTAIEDLFTQKTSDWPDYRALASVVYGKVDVPGAYPALDVLKTKMPDVMPPFRSLMLLARDAEDVKAFQALQALRALWALKVKAQLSPEVYASLKALAVEEEYLVTLKALEAGETPNDLALEGLQSFIYAKIVHPVTLAALRTFFAKKVVNPTAIEGLEALRKWEEPDPAALEALMTLETFAEEEAAVNIFKLLRALRVVQAQEANEQPDPEDLVAFNQFSDEGVIKDLVLKKLHELTNVEVLHLLVYGKAANEEASAAFHDLRHNKETKPEQLRALLDLVTGGGPEQLRNRLTLVTGGVVPAPVFQSDAPVAGGDAS